MSLARAFIHGLEGSSQGTKGRFFKKRFPDMIIGTFRGPFQVRMKKLNNLLGDKTSLVLVGSSFGGVMAAVYASKYPTRVKKLILLAPALTFEEFKSHVNKKIHVPTMIVHGSKDDVVPVEPVRQIAEQAFTDLTFKVVEDDHVLTRTFKAQDWKVFLTV